ncbi:MAG: hypothetical protein ACOCRK_05390 [bacterium]
MRRFKIGQKVLISSNYWDVKCEDQLLKGVIIDVIKKGFSTHYVVKYKFNGKSEVISLESDSIFIDQTQKKLRNKNNKSILRTFNIGDKVLISDEHNAIDGIVIEQIGRGLFKKYVVKYTLNGINRVNTYSPYEIYVNR